MNSHEFDDIIKNKALQHEAEVPADMWENITGQKKKRRFPFFWLLFLSLLFSGIGIVWHIAKPPANSHASTNGKILTREKLLPGKAVVPSR